MKDVDTKKLVRKARKWLASEEGQKALREAWTKADEVCRQLQETRKVDWRTLHESMTI